MAEETNNAPAAKGGIGHIVRVVGPVVDVEFAPSEMPAIYNCTSHRRRHPYRSHQVGHGGPDAPPWRFGSCSCNVVNPTA